MSVYERYPVSPESNEFAPDGPPAGALAGWWRRAGASLIDGVITGGVSIAISEGLGLPLYLVMLVVGGVYTVVRLAMSGRTPGNLALGTAVVTAEQSVGEGLGFGRALLRWFVTEALAATAIGGLLDILWPLWDANNQTIHDKAASTLVVRA